MRVRLIAVIFLAVALAARSQDVQTVITDETVQNLMTEVTAAVEKETGAKLDPALKGKIAEAKEVADLLAKELEPQIPLIQPGADEETCRKLARSLADDNAAGLVAKYAASTNTIYVVRENFSKLATAYGKPALVSREMLRLVMIHEIAHAADQARFKAFDHIHEIKSDEELAAFAAVLEGHAQYVTLKILAREEKGEEKFRENESLLVTAPVGADEEMKLKAESGIAKARFTYVDGLRFFLENEKSRGADFVSKVFAQPPKRREEILHPERWGTTTAPQIRDMSKLWDVLKKGHEEDYTPQIKTFAEVEVRNMTGDLLSKERLEAATKGMRGGSGLLLRSNSEPSSKQIQVIVVEMEDEKAAAIYFDFNADLMKAKDAELGASSGVRITKSSYGELKIKKGQRSLDASRTISLGRKSFEMRDSFFTVGRFAVRMIWAGVSSSTNDVEAQAEKIAEFLCNE